MVFGAELVKRLMVNQKPLNELEQRELNVELEALERKLLNDPNYKELEQMYMYGGD